MKEINVGLIGLGTVGTATARLLLGHKLLLEDRCGFSIKLLKICDKDLEKGRGVDLSSCHLTTQVDDVLEDPEIDVVIELIGGIEPARSFIMKALNNNKHVITANKDLLAKHGDEIFDLAEAQGVDIGFEASVGGGIPVIRTIKEGLVANNFQSLYGIINGTANYILTKMAEEKRDFQSILQEAQNLGYAEADPSYDINGNDTAHKVAILGSIAFGRTINASEVFVSGITNLTSMDLDYAAEFGYKIKLLAILKRAGNEIEVRVHPTMIPCDHQLAAVGGVYNAIFITGDYVGTTMFYGKGAGGEATASAVVSDVVEICRNKAAGIAKRVPCANYVSRVHKDVLSIKNIDDIVCEYYLRFGVVDHPGVLAGISKIMATYNISIASLLQKPSEEGNRTSILIMTHNVAEKDIQSALSEIAALDDVLDETVLIRVENL